MIPALTHPMAPSSMDFLLQEIKEEIKSTANQTGISHLSFQVEQALKKTPREIFVRIEDREDAYVNRPLPIGEGQTISQPFIVALMTELLNLEPQDKVLEIGTGSGYQAAILSQLAQEVYTIEFFSRLTRQAVEKFNAMGFKNIHAITGDGTRGWEEHAPYTKMIVTAGCEEIPSALLDQLAPGGILVVPVGRSGSTQMLTRIKKRPEGQWTSEKILPVVFVPFLHSRSYR